MAFTPEQNQAITATGNVLVSAGAGSGKTTVLSERVLRKVKDGISIDHILILTFTNAAALSMKNKIRKKLIEANLLEQASMVDKAYITTFDSFTNSIVKKYHDRLGINRNINIIDENSIKAYKVDVLNEIFNTYYESNNSLFNKLISDFCLKNDNDLKKNILDTYEKIDLMYDKEDYLNTYIDTYYSSKYIEESVKELYDLIDKNLSIIKEEYKNLEFSLDTDTIKQFDSLLPLLNAKTYNEVKNSLNIELPRTSKKYSDDSKESKNNIKKAIDELDELCISDTLEEDYISTKDYMIVIIDILKQLDKRVMDFKFSHNTFEFNDVAKLAIKLVKENLDVKEELRDFFNEIMIDEYQDTSDLQETLISEIANNNLYMVGDIKQSIYRFRNANPDIFKKKYLDYSTTDKGIKIDLNKNFRSREEDLKDINTIFDKVMDLEYGGADYIHEHEMTFGNQAYVLEGKTEQNNDLDIYNYIVSKDSKYKDYDKEVLEAFIIANDIRNKVDNKYKILDQEKDINELRDVRYSDFSILINKSSSFDTYKKIFEYLNIPLTIYKDINIADSFEFYIFKNILKLLDSYISNNIDNTFKYTFVSIARSYLFNMSDQDIYNIINNNTYMDTDIIKKLDIIKNELDYLDLKNLIIRIKEVFEFDKMLLTYSNINIRISTIEYLIDLASSLSELDYDYHMFIEYLDNIYSDSNAKINIPISVGEDESVRIMTIHKSKGLEYPICYYPEIDNRFNLSEIRNKIFYDTKYGIILPTYLNGYNDTYLKLLAKRRNKQEEISERIRLFYVALTRVKEKMIIVSSINKDETKEKDKDKFNSFLDIINSVRDELDDHIININLEELSISKDYIYKEVSKLDEYEYKDLNVLNYKFNNELEEDMHYSKEINSLITKEKKLNMEYGTRIHELFEFIDFKNADFTNLDITDKEKEYINNFLNQDILKDIKNANILKEYEFYNDNKHGIIDLMLEYSDHIDIIDYKLKHVDDLEYLNQLNGYKEYISTKTKKETNIYLYSILDNELRKV